MKEIEAFKYCPVCGKRLEIALHENKNVLKCASCGYIFFIEPTPTVSAIILKEGKVFLTKRAVSPYKDLWEFPGGFVSLGENLESALAREIKEELGVNITKLKYFTSQKDPYEYQEIEIETLITYFICEYIGEISTNNEIVDYGFFELSKLPEIGSEAHNKIAKMLKNIK